MPRNYTKHEGQSRHTLSYGTGQIQGAVKDVTNGMSYSSASAKWAIDKTKLWRVVNKKHTKNIGGQTALSGEDEELLVKNLMHAAEWGFPLTTFDIRIIVKSFLDRKGNKINCFNRNFPGKDWAILFLRRHKGVITERLAMNIKTARAEITPQTIEEYFGNLETTLSGIPSANVLNYDETNLTDDPGNKKAIVKRGVKHPESHE